MAGVRRLRGLLALAIGVVLVGWVPGFAYAADAAFRITDKRIVESSGLAADVPAGMFWTVNDDSGTIATVYGIAPDGEVQGTLNFRADVLDLEAVAVRDDRLYVGDIGDNKAKRDHVTVYYFDQPRANGLMIGYRAWDFRYPDGAHDAETLLVDSTGRLFVVTKGTRGGGIYRAPKEPSASSVNKLTKVGDAPPLITDGTFLPDGSRIALLSYTTVTVIDAASHAVLASAPIPAQPQAESLALSLDGQTLLVGSEGKRSAVYAMDVPGGATSSASPTPGSGEGEDPGAVPDEPATGLANRGTFLALGLAAVVAVVAGVVVGLTRRRAG